MSEENKHKAGFVSIIGNPNVGKSTLMNYLVGEKLSIITSKAQTTRHRIKGIVNGEDFQIIYSDTPGIITPGYKLQEVMVGYIHAALSDADLLLYVTDGVEKPDKHEDYLEIIRNADIPVLLVLNKIDLIKEETISKLAGLWSELLPGADFFPVSALMGQNMKDLFQEIIRHLPEHPPFYPKDEITDRPERFFVSEIIREKILINYRQEIPYSVEVIVESFKEEEKLIRIRSEIIAARPSQKGIIIGKGGEALKKTGTEARKELEDFLGKKVYLELYVKVRKNWRNNPTMLNSFGYRTIQP